LLGNEPVMSASYKNGRSNS